jgi:uncharacterized protein YaiI (UPF0178 family)
MYKESTNCNEIDVVVTMDVILADVKVNKVSFSCNKVRTKMNIYSVWSLEQILNYFLRYFFLQGSANYRLY